MFLAYMLRDDVAETRRSVATTFFTDRVVSISVGVIPSAPAPPTYLPYSKTYSDVLRQEDDLTYCAIYVPLLPTLSFPLSPPPTAFAPASAQLDSQYRFVMNLPSEDAVVAWQRRQAAKKAVVKVMRK